ncbi:MAG TPA: TetR/AcrR family transcriptional regulator [Solirubrobacterales bacterium]|nr:TetR/AcrR family transcriptional regulator [Solirubrobacterales bacterium]
MTTEAEQRTDAEAPAGDDAFAAQHARLMEGLAASIREKGLAQTQVSDIVRHAHASRRTFYKHFEDKEACFVELMNTLSDAFLEEVDRAIDRERPIDTQIDQAIDTYLGLVTGDADLMATFASPALGERTVVAMRDGFERYAELIVAVVESDSARDPRVAPISVERAYMLVSGLHQTLVRSLVRGEDLGPASAEFKAVMKLVLSGAAG